MTRFRRVSEGVLEYEERNPFAWFVLAFVFLLIAVSIPSVGVVDPTDESVARVVRFLSPFLMMGIGVFSLMDLRFSRRVSLVGSRREILIQDRGLFGVRMWAIEMDEVTRIQPFIEGRHGKSAGGLNTVLELKDGRYVHLAQLNDSEMSALKRFWREALVGPDA